MNEEHIRDGRSPTPSNDSVSKVMRANRRKNTGPEITLRRALREAGLSGYRLQWKVPGRPDIAYPGRKVAIFVNGCFWHMCPRCNLPLPRSNQDYWIPKLRRNKERDSEKREALEETGWTVITVWECEIRTEIEAVVGRIAHELDSRSKEL
ncbi:MAG: very short patch repair endonuclease [Candidatus Methanomethylophilaceae archaeon]|jgi:DNA mismatch endonuclease (patch repair protein)|nr:very short patch repair endonuclease [Candidatus Methanomethylophilaceae archaeon]